MKQEFSEARALIEMYQAGFYDAIEAKATQKGYRKQCIKAFEKRFKKGVLKDDKQKRN
jgi:hypothetical protein